MLDIMPGRSGEVWTVDIKLTWLTGPFHGDIDARNPNRYFICRTSESARPDDFPAVDAMLILKGRTFMNAMGEDSTSSDFRSKPRITQMD
ncbi:hypothetical protein NHQ30_009578 [Ciborinia camelliae]|nr:hypothetical protein NHQ30_009578 [Ciborinia camelliae]